MGPIIGITFVENIEDDPSNNYIKVPLESSVAYLAHVLPRHIGRCLNSTDIDGLLLTGRWRYSSRQF